MQSFLQSSFSLRSRTLLRTASLVLVASATTGCVAAKEYDQARNVAESEAHAHAKTRERLEAAMARIEKLEGELSAREQSLETNATAAEESKLASTVATKEKDAALQLVQELRSELARTGDHLVLFAQEKRDLQQTLLVTEERMRDIEAAGKNFGELVAATRDLSLALRSELEQRSVELGAHDGQVVLALPPEALFAPSGDALVMGAGSVLAAVGKVSQAHPALRIVVREPSAGTAESAARNARLGEALKQNGVAEGRLVMPASRAVPAATAADTTGAAPEDGNAPDAAPIAGKANPKAAATPSSSAPARYEIAFTP